MDMQQEQWGLLKFLSQGWVGIMVGATIAAYTYVKARRFSRLSYQSASVSLVGTSKSEFSKRLELRYDGVVVPRVTASRIVVWNSGRETIHGSQIAPSEPLRLRFESGARVLSVEKTRETRPATLAVASNDPADPSAVTLTFDFLDPGDGIAVYVVHSGGATAPELVGTVKGIPGGFKQHSNATWATAQESKRRRFGVNEALIAASIFFLIFGVFRLLAPEIMATWPSLAQLVGDKAVERSWTGGFTMVFASATLFLMSRADRRHYPATLDPAP